jgi:hypothetical protein
MTEPEAEGRARLARIRGLLDDLLAAMVVVRELPRLEEDA